jgi:hypothetical protein
MYKKFRSVRQLSGIPAGMSGDAGGWETGAAAVGVPGMGLQRWDQLLVCPSQWLKTWRRSDGHAIAVDWCWKASLAISHFHGRMLTEMGLPALHGLRRRGRKLSTGQDTWYSIFVHVLFNNLPCLMRWYQTDHYKYHNAMTWSGPVVVTKYSGFWVMLALLWWLPLQQAET